MDDCSKKGGTWQKGPAGDGLASCLHTWNNTDSSDKYGIPAGKYGVSLPFSKSGCDIVKKNQPQYEKVWGVSADSVSDDENYLCSVLRNR